MPFYDYICQDCGHRVEVRHSVHGHGPGSCPECNGPMKKAMTAAAVHYKGSGWARKERSVRPSKPADDAAKPAPTGTGASAESPSAAAPVNADKPAATSD